MWLTCHRCKHEWDYRANRKDYAQCPKCKTSVAIFKKQTTEQQPDNDKNPPKSKWPDVIISDNFEDVDYITRDPEIIYVPQFKRQFYRGKRRREPEGIVLDSIPEPPEKPKPDPDNILKAIDTLSKIEERERNKPPPDLADAVISGSADDLFNAVLRVKLQQYINRSQ